MRHFARQQHGFLLFEATVAVVVIAVGMVWVSRALTAALVRAQKAHTVLGAAWLAESQLWASGEPEGFVPGAASGTSPDGRFTWSVAVAPGTGFAQEAADASVLPLARAETTVMWEAGHTGQLSLVTYGLEAAQ